MTTAAQLQVKVGADIADFQKKMGSVQGGLTDTAKKMQSVGTKMSLGITTPLAGIGIVAVNMASDLEESLNKVDVVFGNSAGAIKDWSNDASSDLLMTRDKALDAAGSFGKFFQGFGTPIDKSAEMSKAMLTLASDMGSFHNSDPTEMLERIQSGLAGELEPLRKFGVNLSESAVKAHAMEMGLGGVEGKLTDQDKLLARYSLLLASTKQEQGDVARTADGWANKTRILRAKLLETAGAVGEKLLPALQPLLDAVIRAVEWFGNLDPKIQTAIVAFLAIVAAIGPLLVILGTLLPAIGAIGGILGAIVTGPIALVIGAIALLALAWTENWGGIQEKTQAAIDFIKNAIQLGLAFIQELWGLHGPAVSETATQAYSQVQEAIGSVMGFIQETVSWALDLVRGWWEEHGEAVMVIVDAFMGLVSGVIDTTLSVIQTVVENVLEYIRGFWDRHGAAILELATVAWEAIKQVIDGLLQIIGGIVEAAAALIKGDWDAFGKAIEQITEGMRQVVQGIFTALSAYIKTVVRILKTELGIAWTAIKKKAVELVEAMKVSLKNKYEQMKEKIKGSITNLKVKLSILWNQIKKKASDLIEEMKAAIKEKVEKLKTDFVTTITTMATEVITAIKTLLTDAKQAITDEIKNFVKLGENMIMGMYDGIKNKAKKLADKLAQAAADAWRAAKRRLGIGSPSKVLRDEIGIPMIEGIIAGVNKLSPKLMALMRALSEDMVHAVEPLNNLDTKGIEGIGKLMDALERLYTGHRGTLNGILQWIRPQIKAIFITFNNVYDDIHELATDAIPAAEAVDKVVEPIIKIIDTLERLYVMKKQRLGGILAWIRPQMYAVFITMRNINRDIASLVPDAIAAANAVDKVLEPVGKMVDGLNKLYEAQKGKLGGILQYIRGQVWAVFFTFSNIYKDVRAMEGDARGGIATAANVLKEVEDVLTGLGIIYAATKGFVGGRLGRIMSDLAYVTGTMFIVSLRDGLRDARSAIHNELEDLTKTFRRWMQYTVTQFESLGRMIIHAIVAGINQSMVLLDAALARINQRVVQAQRPAYSPVLPGPTLPTSPISGPSVNVTIYNPVGEPSERSLTRQMRNLATVGVL